VTVRQINLHTFPGRPKRPARYRKRGQRIERFGDRAALIYVASAERYAVPELMGLGLGLSVHGKTVIGATLATSSGGSDIKEWASATRLGPLQRAVRITTHAGFTDPESGRLVAAYNGAEWIITADEGRSLGLLAEHRAPATDWFWRGGLTLGVSNWGSVELCADRSGRVRPKWRAKLHEPVLRLKPVGPHGLMASFGKAGRGGRGPDSKPAGRWERDPVTGILRPSRGHLVDLIGSAHAFDGIDTASLPEHLAAFGLSERDIPAAMPVDADAAQQLLDAALAIHRLALAVDKRAASWRVSFGEVFSPGGIAQHQWRATGLVPPLARFANLDDAALDRWAAAGHGGWHR